MTRTSMTFFASADEQRDWLRTVLSWPKIWALAEMDGTRRLEPLDLSRVADLSFQGREHDRRIFFGSGELQPIPALRKVAKGEELLMVKSQAVQFAPSMTTDDILLEGHLAILRERDYLDQRIAFEPVARWFSALARELRAALRMPKVRLVTVSPSHPSSATRGAKVVSQGAAHLAAQGMRLRQFASSNVEFKVEDRV